MDSAKMLEMKGICKYFSGVKALNNVDLTVRKGEVHALLGENGAGKSTLIKILSGSLERDAGEIRFDGISRGKYSPQAAIAMGISVIYQELNLIPEMTVEENLSLGKELNRGVFLDRAAMSRRAVEIMKTFEIDIDIGAQVGRLSVAYQQMVEILKAMLNNSQLVVMDEPSATLTNSELKVLFRIIGELKQQGKSVIYISHRLEEIEEIADRVTILRDGEFVTTRDMCDVSMKELIHFMVGHEVSEEYPAPRAAQNEVVLSVSHLRNGRVRDVNFELHCGEILGIAGLVGAGRTEIARSIFGADRYEGEIRVHGEPVKMRTPKDGIRRRIALIPEDRKTQGALLDMTVAENMTISCLDSLSKGPFIRKKAERELVDQNIGKLRIRVSSPRQKIKNLSGGNQQKVIVTKWFATNSDIMLFDEPTRGIDVGAKHEIYEIMSSIVKSGKSIVMISSELPELIGMSDRILVMYEGQQMGILDEAEGEITQELIMTLASGKKE